MNQPSISSFVQPVLLINWGAYVYFTILLAHSSHEICYQLVKTTLYGHMPDLPNHWNLWYVTGWRSYKQTKINPEVNRVNGNPPVSFFGRTCRAGMFYSSSFDAYHISYHIISYHIIPVEFIVWASLQTEDLKCLILSLSKENYLFCHKAYHIYWTYADYFSTWDQKCLE